MNWSGGRGNLYASFTDDFTDGYKINYYFNLFRRWGVKNPSINFEFHIKIFNDPPYFSRSVGNSVGKLTRSEMHLMHNPLKFMRSIGNFVGKLNPPTTYRRTHICRYGRRWLWHFKKLFLNSLWNADEFISVDIRVGEYGISSNYFLTLCEIPTDINPSVWASVNVAFQVIILWKADRRSPLVWTSVNVAFQVTISSNKYFVFQNISSII